MNVLIKILLVLSFFMPLSVNATQDGMIGEIRMFAGNFAPRNWAFCEGQLLEVASNQALFSILGNRYGGDGRINFALPDLRGRFPLHPGTGPGLTTKTLGQQGGSETLTLGINNLPAHSHKLKATSETATTGSASNAMLATTPQNPTQVKAYKDSNSSKVDMHSESIESVGANEAVDKTPPFLGIHFIICIDGVYPARS